MFDRPYSRNIYCFVTARLVSFYESTMEDSSIGRTWQVTATPALQLDGDDLHLSRKRAYRISTDRKTESTGGITVVQPQISHPLAGD